MGEENELQTSKVLTFGAKLINRLTTEDLRSLHEAFHVKGEEHDNEDQLSLTKDQFCDLLGLVLNKGTREDYEDLFDKLDNEKEGLVDWDRLCSHILLECYEKDDRIKTTQVPQWRELKYLHSPHREQILHLEFIPASSKYCTVSRDGNVCLWNMDITLVRSLFVQADEEELRQKDLWVTDFAIMSNINKLAVSLTSKEILVYDLSSKSEFHRIYRVYNLTSTPLCLDYWHNTNDPRKAYLSFGDTAGCVHVLSFLSANSSLFDRPTQPAATGRDVCQSVNFLSLTKGCDQKVLYYKHNGHSDWARQVQYLPFLECFVSSATTSKDSLVLASIDKSRVQMRLSTFRITQGINGFDYNESANVIATAGISNHVCLWNPYVVSKPVGVLRGHMQSVLIVKFIPSRGQLLSLSKDKVLRVWDTHLQVCLQRLSGVFPKGTDMVISMFYDHERSSLFTSFNHQLTLMVMRAEVKDKIMSHDNPISAIVYNSKFNQVISVCSASMIIMWMFDTGQKVKQFSNVHGNAEITCLGQDPSETKLITGSNDGTLKIWDFNGHCYHVLVADEGNPCEIGQVQWLKQSIVCVGWEKIICNFPTQQLKAFYVYPADWRGKQEHKDDVLTTAFSPPHTLVTGSYDGDIIFWNTTSENAFKRIETCTNDRPPTRLSRKSSFRGYSRHSIRQFSSELGEKNTGTKGEAKEASFQAVPFSKDQGPDASLMDAGFAITGLLHLEQRPQPTSSSSAANLVSASGNGEVSFWNTYSCKLGGKFVPHQHSGLIRIATDPSNSILVTGDGDGACKVWSISDYCLDTTAPTYDAPNIISEFIPHSDIITSLQVVSRFGKKFILTASSDCSIMLHRINGERVGVFGQEEHWKIDALVSDSELSLTEERSNPVADDKSQSKEDQIESKVDIADPPNLASDCALSYDEEYQTWNSTILGSAYREKNTEKRERRQPFTLPVIPSEKGITRRAFKSLSCTELSTTSRLSKPDFMVHPDKYFSEKKSLEDESSVPPLPPILDNIKHRHDMKSIFPKYIVEMDLKMQAAHALASPISGNMFHSAISSSPFTRRSSSKLTGANSAELNSAKKHKRTNREILRRALDLRFKLMDKY